MPIGEKPQSRIAFLRERGQAAVKRQDRTTFSVPFRQKQVSFVEIDVPIDFPLYNVKSGRTHRAQSQYVDRHKLPEDFFNDPEDPRVQRAQHEILLDLVDERSLAKDLSEKDQRNPVVLTYDGFIVDGNRRVTALKREAEAEYVRAVVLPEDATDAEIYETEVELQMATETKAPYNWIDEAIHVRYGVQRLYGMRKPEDALHTVAQHMGMPDDDVKFVLDRLSLVDLYLEWHGSPEKYHLIPTERGGAAEQAFKELAERSRHQQFQRMPLLQQRAIREACFAVILSGGGYMDVRRVADSIRRQPSEFMARLRASLPADLGRALDAPPIASPKIAETSSWDLFGQLALEGHDDSKKPSTAVLNVVGRPDTGKRSGKALIETAQMLDEEQRERRQDPDVQLARVLNVLRTLDLSDGTRNLDEIARLLHELQERVGTLARRIAELKSNSE